MKKNIILLLALITSLSASSKGLSDQDKADAIKAELMKLTPKEMALEVDKLTEYHQLTKNIKKNKRVRLTSSGKEEAVKYCYEKLGSIDKKSKPFKMCRHYQLVNYNKIEIVAQLYSKNGSYSFVNDRLFLRNSFFDVFLPYCMNYQGAIVDSKVLLKCIQYEERGVQKFLAYRKHYGSEVELVAHKALLETRSWQQTNRIMNQHKMEWIKKKNGSNIKYFAPKKEAL